jgi:hypothetical protein
LQSTPFALLKHGDLDTYVIQYTDFYLQQIGTTGSWTDQIFAEAKKHSDVNSSTFNLVQYANVCLGFFDTEYVKAMGCPPSPDERLGG